MLSTTGNRERAGTSEKIQPLALIRVHLRQNISQWQYRIDVIGICAQVY